jgi:hypothetical protein
VKKIYKSDKRFIVCNITFFNLAVSKTTGLETQQLPQSSTVSQSTNQQFQCTDTITSSKSTKCFRNERGREERKDGSTPKTMTDDLQL